MKALGPVRLEGQVVRLEPLGFQHLDRLIEIGQSADIWTYLPLDLSTRPAMEQNIGRLLGRQSQGAAYPFAVVDQTDGHVVGHTSYLDVSAEHRATEIGWTWYRPEVWGTRVNPEAKYLLLRHAFETWGAIRVYFRTDARNLHSQAAIKKLGAQYEGKLRSHRILADGYRRDSMIFSILDNEWPDTKARLQQRLVPS